MSFGIIGYSEQIVVRRSHILIDCRYSVSHLAMRISSKIGHRVVINDYNDEIPHFASRLATLQRLETTD